MAATISSWQRVGKTEQEAILFAIGNALREKGMTFHAKPYTHIRIHAEQNHANFSYRIRCRMRIGDTEHTVETELDEKLQLMCSNPGDAVVEFLYRCVEEFMPIVIMLNNTYSKSRDMGEY